MREEIETKKSGRTESPILPPQFFTAATNANGEKFHLHSNQNQEEILTTKSHLFCEPSHKGYNLSKASNLYKEPDSQNNFLLALTQAPVRRSTNTNYIHRRKPALTEVSVQNTPKWSVT